MCNHDVFIIQKHKAFEVCRLLSLGLLWPLNKLEGSSRGMHHISQFSRWLCVSVCDFILREMFQ